MDARRGAAPGRGRESSSADLTAILPEQWAHVQKIAAAQAVGAAERPRIDVDRTGESSTCGGQP